MILDTETTGLYDAEIVELSIIDTAGNVLLDTLVRPTRPIPAEATVPFETGSLINITQVGAGVATVAAAAGGSPVGTKV